MDEFGVYVHVPFCRRKCRYCDFCSRPPRGGAELDAFVDAVLCEVDLSRNGELAPAATVYAGGGTPSLLGADRLRRLLGTLRERWDVAVNAEITVEANPLDVTSSWAVAARQAGCNRLSLGVQSIIEEDLRFLGRCHRASDGPRAAETARDAGFDEIGIDLIYGLPKQTPAMLEQRLRLAVEACRPTHVSCYQLTYHEGTPLGRELRAGRYRRFTQEEEHELFVTLHRTLADLGYPAYEVSNFSRNDEHRSRHNSRYWRHVPYIGLGPSAHSFLPPVRSWNADDVDAWLTALGRGELPPGGCEILSDEELATEAVMLALRTTDGLDLAGYRDRFGRDLPDAHRAAVDRAVRRGLLEVQEGRLRPTLDGLAVADRLAVELT
jgi:oxygen-independent coproporphyrinogen-3 oxidase